MSRSRVLIVDDDPLLLSVLQTALDDRGYEVLLASDGATALKRITKEKPEVVLLDVMMPVIDGWGVLEAIGKSKNPPRVVALTGKDGPRDAIRAWKAGVDEFIHKPFDTPSLLGLIGEVRRRSDAERSARREQALRTLHRN